MADRLLLIDGHSMAYRAYHALPVENFSTTSGQPTNMIYGFASMLANTLRDERPTHVAVAFDVSRQTFRTEQFPDYKAGRTRAPAEFKSQLKILDDLLAAMSLTTLRVPGFEADDIIATLAAKGQAQGFEVLISTGDRDALQLIGDNVTVLYFIRGVSAATRFTPEALRDKYGLTPAQYPDFAALRGDPSDNLPSIPGIGEKTAARWIREYGSLAGLLERAGEVPGKAGDRLRAALDTVRLNRRLTELVRDVPLPVEPAELRHRPYDLAAFAALLDELEFRNQSLRDRLFAADPGSARRGPRAAAKRPAPDGAPGAPGAVGAVGAVGAAGAAAAGGRVLGPGELAGRLARSAPDGAPTAVVATYVWARGAGRVDRLALASAGAPAAVADVGALTESDERALAAWLADPDRPKVVHDAKATMRVFAGHGWRLGGVECDTELAAYLLRPGLAAYGLDDLAARHLGRRLPGVGDDAPGDAAAALAARAATVLDLAAMFRPWLDKAGATSLLRTVELPLSELLARTERIGVRVDRDLLVALERRFTARIEEATAAAARIAGRPFNPGSTKQLQEVLFDELGLPKTKKIKSGHSTDVDALTWLAERTDSELPAILLRHRDQARLRMTVAGLIKEIGADGRIHTDFRQTVAATGRVTSTEPNLQVIPVRTADGRRIRRAFVPGEGYESIMTVDYNQLELRIMAHLSRDPTLLAAFDSGEDLHATLAAQVFGVAPAAVTADQRRKIKAMSYGLAYGLSTFGLARQLRIGMDEARPLRDAYFARLGGVRDYLEHVVASARQTGYTETILGRRRYLPALTSDNRQRRETAERMALNAPIQGSAADIVKIGMLRVDDALRAAKLGSRLLLQVHDELVLEVAPGERDQVEKLVRAALTGAYPLSVALEVAVGAGPTWDDAAH
ncbi:MAG TPA: DNA polymerase I [Streptosporangiaceae bacterium]|nr:DNA polymerase I [Streptosporangiaceae bacterium]